MNTGRPSRHDVLVALAAAGYCVSQPQLARWHRAGILPQPRQEALGRGRGTVTTYPQGAIEQALALCVILNHNRKLRDAGFTLWWDGFPVRPDLVRAPIERAARQLETQRQQLISGAEYGSPTTPVAGVLARRLGPRGTKAMLDGTRDVLLAQTEPKTLPELGVGDHVPTRGELPQLMAETLGSVLGGSPATQVVAEAFDVDLTQARDRMKNLIEAVARWAEPMAWLMGGNGTVFKIMQLVTESIRPSDYPDMILAMLMMERILPREFVLFLDTPLPDPPGLNDIRLAKRIQMEIPAAKDVVTPVALRALARDKEAAGHHRERIQDFAEAHRPEIDAVVEQQAASGLPGLPDGGS